MCLYYIYLLQQLHLIHESVSDTIRIISCYADICAMRHPKEGAPLVASQKSRIPVINAGLDFICAKVCVKSLGMEFLWLRKRERERL